MPVPPPIEADEHHVGFVGKEAVDVGGAFFGGLEGFLGNVSGTAAFGYSGANENFGWHRRAAQSLLVGVYYDERHALDILLEHVIDGIAAATAHANHHYTVGIVVGLVVFVDILEVVGRHIFT